MLYFDACSAIFCGAGLCEEEEDCGLAAVRDLVGAADTTDRDAGYRSMVQLLAHLTRTRCSLSSLLKTTTGVWGALTRLAVGYEVPRPPKKIWRFLRAPEPRAELSGELLARFATRLVRLPRTGVEVYVSVIAASLLFTQDVYSGV